jgi:hypothetical protein
MTEGLKQTHWTFQDSRVHMLEIDLSKRELRPIMDKQEFPFNEGHPQQRAVDLGAVACGPGGYNITLYHGWGIQDQPQHALVVDQEIWTTGIGGGGYGVKIADGKISIAPNNIQVHVWKPDGSSFEVEHVNRGHEGEVVAFTPRGGTNEFPKYRGKHFYKIQTDTGLVMKTSTIPIHVWPGTIVLESTLDLGILEQDTLRWKQNLGAEGVKHIMSGWPQLVRGGVSIIDEYEMDPTASHGPDNWFVRRNPRTAIGCSEDGRTAYMMCVEGRLPNGYRPDAQKSRGLRLKALAATAVKHGVYSLVNMDGGGSAFQWLKDGKKTVWGCYNSDGDMDSQRRAHFSAAVF